MTTDDGALEDTRLLAAWRGGDSGAGEVLFERHYAAIARFFANKAGDDGPDLTQRTFLALLEGKDRFRADSSFRTYVFGIARNVLYKHLRGKVRLGAFDALRTSVRDLGPSPTAVVAKRRQDQRLLDALRGLPIELQVILELHYWEDLPGPALADVLDIPEGTARTRLRKAKAMLAEELPVDARRPAVDGVASDFEPWVRSLRDLVAR